MTSAKEENSIYVISYSYKTYIHMIVIATGLEPTTT